MRSIHLLAFGFCMSFVSIANGQATLWTAHGGSNGDRFGTAVDFISDLDGDGRDDVIIGAYLEGTAGNQAGKVEVRSGATGALLFELLGSTALEHFGYAVARAGDVNADGTEDFIVGAPGFGVNTPGRIYVYSGVDASLLHTITGPNLFMRLGTSVAGAGDIDGDGHADFIAGATRDSLNPNDLRGSATVFSGATGAVLYKFWGTNDVAGCGYAVAAGKDVNGDGTPDFVVASLAVSHPNASGEVQVFSGADGTRLHLLDALTPFEWFGVSVALPGDLNGDGKADVLVGAKTARPGNVFNAGAARLFSGADGSLIYELSEGKVAEFFGTSVAAAGDVDGDGTNDIVVGAARGNNFTWAGDAHVYSGVNGQRLFVFVGDETDDDFGAAVAGAGDLDGDGLSDILVGAPLNDSNGQSSGLVRSFSGGTATCFEVENYCTTSPNSVGPGALITHLGSPSVSANKLWLRAEGVPTQQPGLFFFSNGPAQLPFGNGVLCLAGPFLRGPVQTANATLTATLSFDPAAPPAGGAFLAGTRRHFQYAYRDPGFGAGMNTSDAMYIDFCP